MHKWAQNTSVQIVLRLICWYAILISECVCSLSTSQVLQLYSADINCYSTYFRLSPTLWGSNISMGKSVWWVVSTPLNNIKVTWDDSSQAKYMKICSTPPTKHVLRYYFWWKPIMFQPCSRHVWSPALMTLIPTVPPRPDGSSQELLHIHKEIIKDSAVTTRIGITSIQHIQQRNAIQLMLISLISDTVIKKKPKKQTYIYI